MGGRTSNASKTKYNAKAYDKITLTVYKGQREQIKEYAKGWGGSFNSWAVSALLEKMQRDGPPPKMGAGAGAAEKEE